MEDLKSCVMEVNMREKELDIIYITSAIFFSILVLALYFVLFREMEFFSSSFLAAVVHHIGSEIASLSVLGIFYANIIGGFFFTPVPIEAISLQAINKNGNGWVYLIAIMAGTFISYTFNYVFGLKLSNFSRKLISVKKFYQMKTWINRYGIYGVFVFNLLPFASQQLIFVLGVFRYNKTRLIVFSFLGQLLKNIAIILGIQQVLQQIL